jgi:hypothetical protein
MSPLGELFHVKEKICSFKPIISLENQKISDKTDNKERPQKSLSALTENLKQFKRPMISSNKAVDAIIDYVPKN